MRCEKFQGITTEEACLAQQKARKILCQTCDQPLGEKVGKKQCKMCGENKPVTEFSSNKKSKDGLRNFCKLCNAALMREYHLKKKGIPGNTEPKPHTKEKPMLSPLKLTVDFREYPQLYDFVMRGPKEFLRTPENMILYGVALLQKEKE